MKAQTKKKALAQVDSSAGVTLDLSDREKFGLSLGRSFGLVFEIPYIFYTLKPPSQLKMVRSELD